MEARKPMDNQGKPRGNLTKPWQNHGAIIARNMANMTKSWQNHGTTIARNMAEP